MDVEANAHAARRLGMFHRHVAQSIGELSKVETGIGRDVTGFLGPRGRSDLGGCLENHQGVKGEEKGAEHRCSLEIISDHGERHFTRNTA